MTRWTTQKHLKIARTLQEIAEPNAFLLGRHFFRAGAKQDAEPYLWQAYQQAERMGLLRDSVKFFDFWVRSVTVRDAAFWSRVLEALDKRQGRLDNLFTQTCLFLMEASKEYDDLEVRSIVQSTYLLGIREEPMEVNEGWFESTRMLAEQCGTYRAKLAALKAIRMAVSVDSKRSMELQLEILKVAPHVSTEEHIYALARYGKTLQYTTQYDKARDILNQARELADGAELRFLVRYELINARAMLEGECGNPELALEIFRSVSNEVFQHASERDIAFYHCSVAQHLIGLKRYEEALAECERAEVIFGYLPFHNIRAMVAIHQVEIAEMLGDVAGAHRVYSRGEMTFNHPKLKGYRFAPFWKYYRARFLRRIGDFEGSSIVLPPLGVEPYLDACVLAEQGFMALATKESVEEIISRFEELDAEVGFAPASEPGQLLIALKRAAAAALEERFHGEFISDFPPKLLAALQD